MIGDGTIVASGTPAEIARTSQNRTATDLKQRPPASRYSRSKNSARVLPQPALLPPEIDQLVQLERHLRAARRAQIKARKSRTPRVQHARQPAVGTGGRCESGGDSRTGQSRRKIRGLIRTRENSGAERLKNIRRTRRASPRTRRLFICEK
jgi:hypothetical protein